MQLANYSRVKLITDAYTSEGAKKNSTGYIIEIYPGGAYEVEFSDPSGVSYAQIVAKGTDLKLDPEPLKPSVE